MYVTYPSRITRLFVDSVEDTTWDPEMFERKFKARLQTTLILFG